MAHLRLKLTSQNNGQHLKQFEFSSQGGSIGRSDLCDWTLFDQERFISKKHAEIFFQNNQFYVSDTSTNGIFINNTGSSTGYYQQVKICIGYFFCDYFLPKTLSYVICCY